MNNNSTNSMKNISTTNQSNYNNNNIQNSSNKKSNSSSKSKSNNINNKIINNIVNNIQEGSTQINIYTNSELLKSVHLHNASVLNCTNLAGNQKSKSPGIVNQKSQINNYMNNNKPKFNLNLRKILHKQIFENKKDGNNNNINNNNVNSNNNHNNINNYNYNNYNYNNNVNNNNFNNISNINNNNNNTSERNAISNNFFEKYGKYFLTNKLDSKIHTTKLNKDKTRILNKNQSQKKLSTKLRANNSCHSIHSGLKSTKFENNINKEIINSRSINIKISNNNINSSTSINNNNNNSSKYNINNNNNNLGNITSRALSPYQCIPRNCNLNNFNCNNNEKIKFKSLHDLSKYLVKINNGNITMLSDKNKKNKITFK